MKIDITTVFLMGFFFVILALGIMGIAFFTMYRVRKYFTECKERFDQIENVMKQHIRTTENFADAIAKFNEHIKPATEEKPY